MPDSFLFLAVLALAAVVVLANLAEQRIELRPALTLTLLTFNAAFVVLFGFGARDGTVGTLLLAFAFGGLATLLLLEPVRWRIAGLFPARRIDANGQPSGYDPTSPLHMTAMVYAVYLIGNTLLSYALAGGLGGLSQQAREDSGGLVSPSALVMQMLLLILFGMVGTGLGTRRRLSGVLFRLGLRAPTLRELLTAVAVAFWLFWAAFLIGAVWQLLAPPDVIRDQTELSGLIAASITTLMGAFMLAGTAAVGEEIAFRGALQPVFGIWPTSVVFALTHIQYTLTPATLVILLVSYGFGWVRRRHNTTAAIVAHFLYNFALMALAVYGRYVFTLIDSMR